MKIFFIVLCSIIIHCNCCASDNFSIRLLNTSHRIAGAYTSYSLKIDPHKNLPRSFVIFIRFSHAYYNTRPQNMLYQVSDPLKPGYVSCENKDVSLSIYQTPHFFSHPTIKIVLGRSFSTHESFTVTIGDKRNNNPGIRAQYFAEKSAPILCLYYNDDQKLVYNSSSPVFSIHAAEPAQIFLHIPSIIRSHTQINVRSTVADIYGNRLDIPYTIKEATLINLADHSKTSFTHTFPHITLTKEGSYVLEIHAHIDNKDIYARSNACVISSEYQKLFFGDFHGHTDASDGIGSVKEYFQNAQHAFLDFASLTEHDKMLTRSESRSIEQMLRNINSPGSFVCFAGWEYDILCGDRNFYYFKDFSIPVFEYNGTSTWQYEYSGIVSPPPVRKYSDFRFSPLSLYDELRTHDQTLVIQHTPASASMGNGLDYFDPMLERVIEIYSSHGNSLYRNSIYQIPDFIDSGSVVSALNRGYKLGFVACGDSHAGRPGNTIFGRFPGGLTAIYSSDLTRENVYSSLYHRNCYATTGHRPIIEFKINNQPMGSNVHADSLDISFKNTSAELLKTVNIFCNGSLYRSFKYNSCCAENSFSLLTPPKPSYYFAEFCYENNNTAWSSPIFTTAEYQSVINDLCVRGEQSSVFTLNFSAEPESMHQTFLIYRRAGNDGNADIKKYRKIGGAQKISDHYEYQDNDVSEHISYYYMVQEILTDGSTVETGPVSICLPPLIPTPVNTFDPKKQNINFWTHKKSDILIRFYHLSSNKIIKTVPLKNISAGIHTFHPYEILKDFDFSPLYVKGFNKKYFVCSYDVVSENIASPKKVLCWDIQ